MVNETPYLWIYFHSGYVQGMNFIMGALLYHCSEEIAFWLFTTLIYEYQLSELYERRLPGLAKHCEIIDKLILAAFPHVHNHFVTQKHTKFINKIGRK